MFISLALSRRNYSPTELFISKTLFVFLSFCKSLSKCCYLFLRDLGDGCLGSCCFFIGLLRLYYFMKLLYELSNDFCISSEDEIEIF